jgi:hypothetical protein
MSRKLSALLLAASAIFAVPAVAGDAFTTRIEPLPYYGAVVTMEAGVRVFRPLPPTRHVIVNPGGQTPLNLSYEDVRIKEESRSYNYSYNYDYGRPYYGAPSIGGFFPGRGFRHHGGHGHHHPGVGKGIGVTP